eukprot:CAMPEP_0195285892 /NCGR_PEP_ID=MMETSP0707-20130614/3565_1 /TAXON_ID=33640 /ORGANISM="Asterionellopsis glacialis, Strain CCMP134" /LENGTH=52 /DNA_ID=CAMNT_0040345461 /DNA_START=123 /DNA_END=281 /DNA_ORIENTATION=+
MVDANGWRKSYEYGETCGKRSRALDLTVHNIMDSALSKEFFVHFPEHFPYKV